MSPSSVQQCGGSSAKQLPLDVSIDSLIKWVDASEFYSVVGSTCLLLHLNVKLK